ncbi:MAG TPA: CcmD family protein [Polyangiaceae bacterium]
MKAQETTSPGDRAQTWTPVGQGTETTSAELMLVLAYVVMWALLLGFLGLGWRRQGQMEARIVELERAVGSGKAPGA